MSTKIHSVDDYIKGLEEQGIVVHSVMRDTIKRLNGHGVLDGYPAADDGLFPDNDHRYEAGHLDRVKDRQRVADEWAAQEIERQQQQKAQAVPSSVPRKPVPYLAKFALRDRVTMDGCADLIGTITAATFRTGSSIEYEVSWMHNGDAKSAYVQEFRLTEAK